MNLEEDRAAYKDRMAEIEARKAAVIARYSPELWAAASAAYDLIDVGYDAGDSAETIIAIIADAMEAWRSRENSTV